MKTYSTEDRQKIAAMHPGSVCRVVELKHLYAEKYETIGTTAFASQEEAMALCLSTGGGEVDVPEYFGDMAFSADGKRIFILTNFS
jgi:hypothetical protein